MSRRPPNWGNLTTVQKRNILLWSSGQALARGAALWDLRRRPANEIRGGKCLWTALLVSFWLAPPATGQIRGSRALGSAAAIAGFLIPVAYVVWGRKRSETK